MKHPHIAFISFPQHPYVGPTLPIVAVLVRRGYRVTCATSDLFASRVAAVGAEFVPISRVSTYMQGAVATADAPYPNPYIPISAATLAEITPFYERERPALIIYNFGALAGRILAARWNIPAVQASPIFAFTPRNFTQQVNDPEMQKVFAQYNAQIATFLESHGARGTADWIFHRDSLNVYLFPNAIQPFPDPLDESCLYAGRCAGEQPCYGEWQLREREGKPMVLVATSTHYVRGPEYFRMCIEALAGMQWRVILSIGDSGDSASLQPLPPDFEIVQRTAHIKILPHADLMISLGGIISSSEAAYHGVPQIVLSHGYAELEWQAENLVRLGVASHLRKADMSSGALRQRALDVMNDHEMQRRVTRLQHIVKREPGAEETANRIENCLRG